jgi:hypothetical protein
MMQYTRLPLSIHRSLLGTIYSVWLICIFALTSGLEGITAEHKDNEHRKVSASTNHENKAKSNSNSNLDSNVGAKDTESEVDLRSPEEAFEFYRKTLIKHFLQSKASPDHPIANRLVEAIKPTMTQYLKVPFALKEKREESGLTVLTYQSTDPNFDMSVTLSMQPQGNSWTLVAVSTGGEKGIALLSALSKETADAFPVQYSSMWVFIFALIVSCFVQFVAVIWFDVVAFRTSLGWGFATLLIPGAGMVFACLNWQVAKKPSLTLVASMLATLLTLLIPVWVGYSLRDIVWEFSDFVPNSSTSPVHEI